MAVSPAATVYQFLDPKAAAAITRRTFNLTAWLQGDTLASTPTVTVDQDQALNIMSVVTNGALVTVWLSAGTAGVTYTLTMQVNTGDGRDDFIKASLAVV